MKILTQLTITNIFKTGNNVDMTLGTSTSIMQADTVKTELSLK